MLSRLATATMNKIRNLLEGIGIDPSDYLPKLFPPTRFSRFKDLPLELRQQVYMNAVEDTPHFDHFFRPAEGEIYAPKSSYPDDYGPPGIKLGWTNDDFPNIVPKFQRLPRFLPDLYLVSKAVYAESAPRFAQLFLKENFFILEGKECCDYFVRFLESLPRNIGFISVR